MRTHDGTALPLFYPERPPQVGVKEKEWRGSGGEKGGEKGVLLGNVGYVHIYRTAGDTDSEDAIQMSHFALKNMCHASLNLQDQ